MIAKFGSDLTKVRNFARLFRVPGMHHCGGGPGPNVFDAMVPLVLWVETLVLGFPPSFKERSDVKCRSALGDRRRAIRAFLRNARGSDGMGPYARHSAEPGRIDPGSSKVA